MMTPTEITELCQQKKYKPVKVTRWGNNGFRVWCETRAGITQGTLTKRFTGTGWDASVFGYDPVHLLHYFVLREEK
jgi:hypothetical protein